MSDWQAVFKLATKVAKELKAKNPKLTYPEATKLAWQSPEVKKAKAAYDAKKATATKKKK